MRKKGDFFALIEYIDGGGPRDRRVTNLTEEELREQIVLPYNNRHAVLPSNGPISFASICQIRVFAAVGKFRDGVMRAVAELEDIKQMIDEEDGEHFKEVTSYMLKAPQDIAKAYSPSTNRGAEQSPSPSGPSENYSTSRVFIVHGRDDAMKEAVARVIEKLNLEPVILHEQPELGRTIIEKFTQCSDVGYALVLLSPDDFAYPRDSTPEKGLYRARQNVILELGYFIGKLGRGRVMALNKGGADFEIPTDFAGVVYTPFDEQWRFKLVKELKACGYSVSADQLL
jgi:predicted nucleotide-binding protein